MYRIARFAVNNPVTVLMLVLGILLLGLISFGKLGTDLFPDLNTPKIYIELKAGERPPEEIERNYVDQIESLAMRQSDVTQVSSVSRAGSALVTVEYKWGKDMDDAFLNLQKEMRAFAQNSDLEDFTISQYDPNASPVMTVAMMNERISNMDELRKTAENYIRNELIRIEGVADVRLTGQEESEVVIETNKYILEAYGISADDIAAKIRSYNRNASGGSITEMGLRYTIKGVSVLKDLRDFENIIIAFRQKQNSLSPQSAATMSENVPVYLRDIASVRMENRKPENYVTLNGQRCIGLLVYKEPKFNTVDAVKNLNKAFGELEKALPGYEFIRIHDQGNYIKNAISEVRNTLLAGILLAVFVLYLFLRRIGTTLAVSIAIPVSIIATFNLMYFNHLTLNIMTLGGLALGAGMLVDNAIVVLENISRNREEGMDMKEAIITGTGQVSGAITASTVTTIVVFLPIVYLHGASGEMFRDQAWTVAFSLVSSLLVALLVIPMLTSLFISGKNKNSAFHSSIRFKWYNDFLKKVLEKRWLIISLSAILLFITGLLIPKLGSEFMPKPESSEFTLNLKLPEGTALERTVNTVANVESMIKEMLPGKIKMIYSLSGEDKNTTLTNLAEGSGQNTAMMKIMLSEEIRGDTENAIAIVENYLKNIPELEFSFTREETALQSSLGTTAAPFELEISGKELSVIEKFLEESKKILSGHPSLYNITTSVDEGIPQVEVSIDRFRCSYYNITVDNVINQIKSYLSGSSAGSIEQGGETKDITIKLGEITLEQLKDMIITASNLQIPLSELAEIKTVISQREITRRNQTRTVYLYAMVRKGEKFDHVINKAEEMLSSITLPTEYKIEFTGEELKRRESMSSLTFALLLSLILVYMVLASQFESLIQPFVIMLTIPLAAVGTVLAFFLLGKSLNMMAYIGIIMLAGIAVNNAIILVDRINQLRKEGMQVRDAIINAGGQRIRPIFMTSLTTILALLPLTAGIGESASLRSPMALAVIGGLVTSTILTLIVIPCVYLIFENSGRWHLRGKTTEK